MADSAYIGFDLAAIFVKFSCWFADFGRCLFGSVYAALPDNFMGLIFALLLRASDTTKIATKGHLYMMWHSGFDLKFCFKLECEILKRGRKILKMRLKF